MFFKTRISADISTTSRIGTVTNLSLAFEGLEATQPTQRDIGSFLVKSPRSASGPTEESPSKRHSRGKGSRSSEATFIDLTQDDEAIVIDSDSDDHDSVLS